MGSPPHPTREQYAQLERAGALAELGGPEPVPVKEGRGVVRFSLPRQGVSLLVLEW